MLKKEDIRKEEIIMKIIKLIDYFLKKEEKSIYMLLHIIYYLYLMNTVILNLFLTQTLHY